MAGFIVLLVALAVVDSITADLSSSAFRTGLTLGRNFEDLAGENSVRSTAENCLDKIASQTLDELQGVGFHFDAQLLSQITDDGVRQKICSIYNNAEKKVELEECQRTQPALKNSVPGVFVLLKLVCYTGKEVLERNSACLSDMETNLHKTCLVACRRQAGLSADAAELDDRDNKMVCKVGACAAQCLAAQVQECEEAETSELKEFYDRLSGAQMLLGLESAHIYGNAINTRVLLKSQKLPAKCQQIIQRSARTMSKVSATDSTKPKEGAQGQFV